MMLSQLLLVYLQGEVAETYAAEGDASSAKGPAAHCAGGKLQLA
jgi:hypothetical protein